MPVWCHNLEGKQLFIQYDKFNGDAFLDFLKGIHTESPRCYLFMNKASPHYRSRKVTDSFEHNKDTLIPLYLPTTTPDFMVMEGWNMAKNDLLVLKHYSSFDGFRKKISSISEEKDLSEHEERFAKRCLGVC